MATRTLLNEAIAEAESIREAALANAKAALEESFAPHIKEMFSKKVQEMDKEDDKIEEMKEKDEEKEGLDEMDAPSFDRKSGPSITPTPEKVGKTTVQEEEEVALDDLLATLDEEMDSEEETIEEMEASDDEKEDIKEAEGEEEAEAEMADAESDEDEMEEVLQ